MPDPASFLALSGCLVATGCSDDPHETYCAEVEEHQAELSDIAASDDAGALFDALDDYDELRRKVEERAG